MKQNPFLATIIVAVEASGEGEIIARSRTQRGKILTPVEPAS